ncbi:MAG: thioesterase family protein [Pseudomonadota bacterium]
MTQRTANDGWDLPTPFLIDHAVAREDIDGLGHANNTSYMRWCERVSWAHSESLGITLDTYQTMRRAMVIRRCEYDYLSAAYADEPLRLATWVVECDEIIRIVRRFQIRNAHDGRTLLRARTEFACINLDTGRASRMPQAFADTYASVLTPVPEQRAPNRPS